MDEKINLVNPGNFSVNGTDRFFFNGGGYRVKRERHANSINAVNHSDHAIRKIIPICHGK